MSNDHERVYVLRLWDEESPPHRHRISLYHALSGERRYFSTLDALVRHLNAQLHAQDDPPEAAPLQS